jgi:hypothetical protein
MKSTFLFFFLFVGTIAMIGVMRWHSAPLVLEPHSKSAIVSLEFAKSKQRADQIVSSWTDAGVQQHAVNNVSIDFLFLFFYSLFLFAACYWFSFKQTGHVKRISQTISLFGLIAGLLDVIENYFLYQMLKFNASDIQIEITYWIALTKFLLVGIVTSWMLISLLLRVTSYIRHQP